MLESTYNIMCRDVILFKDLHVNAGCSLCDTTGTLVNVACNASVGIERERETREQLKGTVSGYGTRTGTLGKTTQMCIILTSDSQPHCTQSPGIYVLIHMYIYVCIHGYRMSDVAASAKVKLGEFYSRKDPRYDDYHASDAGRG